MKAAKSNRRRAGMKKLVIGVETSLRGPERRVAGGHDTKTDRAER
jgi:hypothetical protein